LNTYTQTQKHLSVYIHSKQLFVAEADRFKTVLLFLSALICGTSQCKHWACMFIKSLAKMLTR